ncbi:unnamed protein product [Periconia digitata]|uniref:Uncharacterized protein n=1 Tax=Periconia digitata TaxID=1303443 RepID=A0A9W4XRU1_9PLEO|nr:unnamed protein product [Periconia digitata]
MGRLLGRRVNHGPQLQGKITIPPRDKHYFHIATQIQRRITMASRADSDVFDDDPFDPYSAESSPDPLSRSINENTPSVRRSATRSSKKPLVSTSPSKQNRGQSASSFDIVSPSKSMILNTPRGTGASPWRIKVTVQAEPDAGDENASSPIVQHMTRTHTTTVPLKDADASSPAKRRGRPRKSDASSANTKRNGTPVRKTPRPHSKTRDITTESSFGGVETDSVPKKRRGRPRKSQLLSEEQTLEALSQDLNFTGISMREESASPKKNRGRPRKSIQPIIQSEEAIAEPGEEKSTPTPQPAHVDIPVIETTVPTPQSRRTQSKQKMVGGELVEKTRFTPPQTDLSKSIRRRKNTPAAKEKVLVHVSSEEMPP